MVELFSKILIEIVLQNTRRAPFSTLTNEVEISIAYNLFHGEETAYIYQSKAPVESIFNEAGHEQPVYLSEKDALIFAFKQYDIEFISSLLPAALKCSGVLNALELCANYILARAKDSSLGTDKVGIF